MTNPPNPRPGKTICLIQAGKHWVVGENNPEKTSPKLKRAMPNGHSTYTIHAEDRALQLADRNGGKIKRVIVLRWTKSGRLSMARPCEACEARLLEAGVKHRQISYSDWGGKIVAWGE